MNIWDQLADSCDARKVAKQLIEECTTFNMAALSDDPFGVLTRSPEINLLIEGDLDSKTCGGGGYYRPSPPTIHLHPATSRRDNFTLLHELGHHLQQCHDQWAYTLIDLSDADRRRIEEAVSDQFAAQVLLPVDDNDRFAAMVHPADVMAGLFARTQASRPASMRAVHEMLPPNARWLLAVAGLDGTVTASASTYDDPQPPVGLAQVGFKRLAIEALDAAVRRQFHEGIEYKTGSVLDDLHVEAAIDHFGEYLFVALRPTTISGCGTRVYPEHDCVNAACGETFSPRQSGGRCSACQSFRCPRCHQCGCAAEPVATCPDCFIAFTPAEIASGNHECF